MKVVSISHAIDPDGIGSQAIIFRYFRELDIEPIAFLADYHYFEETFEKAVKLQPDVLIVTDFGWNDSYLKLIDSLKQLKARTIWIDHHKISIENRLLLENSVDELIIDTSVCAAELVQERFMPDDPVSKEIARIAHNGDFDIEDPLSQMFYTLIDFRRYSSKGLEEIREMFATGKFDEETIRESYLEAYKAFEADRDRIRRTTKTIQIAGKSIAVAHSSLLPRGKVTKFLSEFREEDILLAIDTTSVRVGLRSSRYDVAAIAKALGGGGHRHRSGFNYQNALNEKKELTNIFLKDLEEAIQKTTSEKDR
ncbi:MAG: hypothetical protein GF308_05075 [Candidatus Heimdallarchaeota archaeon]|nr:hypothetical protein [Candidatus Heimdallarchaeota archaeon]